MFISIKPASYLTTSSKKLINPIEKVSIVGNNKLIFHLTS